MYFRISRFKLKPEAVSFVRENFEKEVMGPAVASKGNRFFCVLLSTEEERVGSQISGWDSKEDCDRWLKEVWPIGYKQFEWVFEEKPQASFWELKWPGMIQF
ncbi:MAG: hypothetical protein ACE5JL_18415 [Dehalococcoidia bacterium]